MQIHAKGFPAAAATVVTDGLSVGLSAVLMHHAGTADSAHFVCDAAGVPRGLVGELRLPPTAVHWQGVVDMLRASPRAAVCRSQATPVGALTALGMALAVGLGVLGRLRWHRRRRPAAEVMPAPGQPPRGAAAAGAAAAKEIEPGWVVLEHGA